MKHECAASPGVLNVFAHNALEFSGLAPPLTLLRQYQCSRHVSQNRTQILHFWLDELRSLDILVALFSVRERHSRGA